MGGGGGEVGGDFLRGDNLRPYRRRFEHVITQEELWRWGASEDGGVHWVE